MPTLTPEEQKILEGIPLRTTANIMGREKNEDDGTGFRDDRSRLIPWLHHVKDDESSRLPYKEGNFRIDHQGDFKVKNDDKYEWHNFQVQLNIPRGANSTTVITTFVHKEAYTRGLIPKRVVLEQMLWQVYHNHSEAMLYLRTNTNIGKVPRHPCQIPFSANTNSNQPFEIKTSWT